MSEIANLTPLQNATKASQKTQTAEKAASGAGSAGDMMGKEDFLTLLVAQLKNQDPLNPDEPTEFTAQLAQFSSLEQLFNLNDSMKNLATSNANGDRFATLQTIGKNVVYQESSFDYDGKMPIELGYQLDGPATQVQLTIKKNGATVRVLDGSELTKGNHFLSWDGLDKNGDPAGSGAYSVSISAKAGEGKSVAASPLLKSEVTGVDLTGEYGGKLLTKAGEVAFTSILGVYELGSAVVDEDPEEIAVVDESAAATDTSDNQDPETPIDAPINKNIFE